ncbi:MULTISPECIES: nuclear transport factor 2 family protein [unclassified Variovorax]|uniref:nuclear transport factor 2 family protein n=1 Tax=Variovorax TaxID=34072 RepID=UPI0030B5E888
MTKVTTATDLLNAYLNSVSNPEAAGALFAEDGILELPTVNARAQGPAAVADLLTGLLKKVPDFAFQEPTFWIQTPERVFAEYRVEALVPGTGKIYRQVYAGVLIAEDGRIKLLREALDTAEAARAFKKD